MEEMLETEGAGSNIAVTPHTIAPAAIQYNGLYLPAIKGLPVSPERFLMSRKVIRRIASPRTPPVATQGIRYFIICSSSVRQMNRQVTLYNNKATD
jgi:hypothetical protein